MISVYKILDKAEYDKHDAYFESKEFGNLGKIRWNISGTRVLLEQEESKYPEGLVVFSTFTQEEVVAYIDTNTVDWNELPN